MHFKSLKKRLFCILLTFVLVLTQLGDIQKVVAIAITESSSRKSDLQIQNSELNRKLSELREDQSKQEAYRETLQSQIAVVEKQIDEAGQQIRELDSKIQSLESVISEYQGSIDSNFEILKQRIRAIYKAGDSSVIEILLQAKNVTEFLDKAAMIKFINDHDSKLIAMIKDAISKVKSEKDEVDKARIEVLENRETLDKKQSELSDLLEESKKVTEELEGEKGIVLDQIDQNDAELQKINAEIEEYYAKLREEAKKEESRSTPSESSSSSDSSSQVSPGEPSKKPSGYIWPVPGFYQISSPFEDEEDRIRPHTGIDIAGPRIYGARVVAAASGRVIKVSEGNWGGGYGTHLLIDHGDGRATLYAHLSALAAGIEVGKEVEQGDTVGYVGRTGNSTGPHLHFETRKDGKVYNPRKEV